MDRGAANARWSAALLGACAEAGLAHVVLSPGSRSTPLVLGALQYPQLTLHVQPDERAAAFFALGIAMHDDGACAVLATSGTAVANWYPAIIEAAQSQIPLLLISADRPHALVEAGANQSIDQRTLFGEYLRDRILLEVDRSDTAALQVARAIGLRAMRTCIGPVPGPVQINVGMHEPLVPETWSATETPEAVCADEALLAKQADDHSAFESAAIHTVPATQQAAAATAFARGPGCIVCGPGTPASAHPAILRLAERLDCPVLADVLSGLRFGAQPSDRVIAGAGLVVADAQFAAAAAPAWVLRTGREPVSSPLQRFVTRCESVLHAVPNERWPGAQRADQPVLAGDMTTTLAALADRAQGASSALLDQFRDGRTRIERMLDGPDVPLEFSVLRALQQRLPDSCRLLIGNSLVARDADACMTSDKRNIRVFGNRGASGIDGNVSMALGLAAAAGERVIALLGDLALFHDMNGLLMSRDVTATLIVFANGGGHIFRGLAQQSLPNFERLWACDPKLRLRDIARLHGLRHERAGDAEKFALAFEQSLKQAGVTLIEVHIDPAESIRRRGHFHARLNA